MPPYFGIPDIKARARHVLAAEVGCGHSRLVLTQGRNDLFFAESLPFHLLAPSVGAGLHRQMEQFARARQTTSPAIRENGYVVPVANSDTNSGAVG